MYAFVVFLHVLGAFAFVALHGVSLVTSFRLRGERDRTRQVQLLELSQLAAGLMYIGLLLLLVAGIVAGFMGDHWGRGWIWASLGALVVTAIVMYAVGTSFYGRMRAAAGLPASAEAAAKFKPPATEADLDALAITNRPLVLAAVGAWG